MSQLTGGATLTTMAHIRVTYDAQANAAYIYLTDPQVDVRAATTYPCDPAGVGGMINLDFDAEGRVIGVEVLAARSKLSPHLLEAAERIDEPSGGEQVRDGDVFLVPVVDDAAAVGRVVKQVDGSVLIAVYPDLVEAGAEFDVGCLAGLEHVFLLETLDDELRKGTWRTVGNWTPRREIAVPVNKVRAWPDDGYFEQTIGGVVGRRLTEEEAEKMAPPRSYSTNIVALAVRMLHGLAPRLPVLDELRVGARHEGR